MKNIRCIIGLHDWQGFRLYEKCAGRDTMCKAKQCKRCGKVERVK